MKRQLAHFAFGGVAALCALSAVVSAFQLRRAERVNAVIAEAGRAAAEDAKRPLPEDAAGVPEAALARALVIAAASEGSYEAALHAFDAISQTPHAALRLVIRYDLANLHLREALRVQDTELAKAKTYTELAKQNYRYVLEREPQNWPARYNLERALWLSPEKDEPAIETATPPPPQRPNGDKPDLP